MKEPEIGEVEAGDGTAGNRLVARNRQRRDCFICGGIGGARLEVMREARNWRGEADVIYNGADRWTGERYGEGARGRGRRTMKTVEGHGQTEDVPSF